jgi:hypothetical protein
MTDTRSEEPVEHAGSLKDTIDAAAAVFAAARSDAKPYVAVAVSDTDEASLIGAYAVRSVAQAQASRASGDRSGAWIRAYVVAPATDGGCVVLSGDVVIGQPASS